MSQSNPDFYQSKNKEKVRDDIWTPVIVNLQKQFQKVNSRRKKNFKTMKYLCFPGESCVFELDMLERGFFPELIDIVAIEKVEEIVESIKEKLIQKCTNAYVYNGKIGILVVNQLKNKFPFDVANLDITGSYFSGNKSTHPHIKMLSIYCAHQSSKMIEQNMKDSYIIITSNLQGANISIKQLIKKSEKIIEEINQYPNFSEKIKDRVNDPFGCIAQFIAIVLYYMIYKTVVSHFDTHLFSDFYIYQQRPKGAIMCSFVLKITQKTPPTMISMAVSDEISALASELKKLYEKIVILPT